MDVPLLHECVCVCAGGGGVLWDYDTWPSITILSRYSDSAIIDQL